MYRRFSVSMSSAPNNLRNALKTFFSGSPVFSAISTSVKDPLDSFSSARTTSSGFGNATPLRNQASLLYRSGFINSLFSSAKSIKPQRFLAVPVFVAQAGSPGLWLATCLLDCPVHNIEECREPAKQASLNVLSMWIVPVLNFTHVSSARGGLRVWAIRVGLS